jgi:hypothetical protein
MCLELKDVFFTAKVFMFDSIVFVEMLKKGAEATQMFGGGL